MIRVELVQFPRIINSVVQRYTTVKAFLLKEIVCCIYFIVTIVLVKPTTQSRATVIYIYRGGGAERVRWGWQYINVLLLDRTDCYVFYSESTPQGWQPQLPYLRHKHISRCRQYWLRPPAAECNHFLSRMSYCIKNKLQLGTFASQLNG